MKLTVTGRYVDLDFQTPVPIKLSQQFSTDTIAQSAAKVIARRLDIRRFEVVYYSKEKMHTVIKRIARK